MIDYNIFDQIYSEILLHADKILSALAFVGTIIVGFAYKKGLLPLLGKAVNAISQSVEGIKEEGVRTAKNNEEKFEEIDNSIKTIEASSEKTGTAISNIEAQLSKYENALTQYTAMKTVMSAQTDMLYAVFMSSSLPQYQKDEIGERIKGMRRELELDENGG